MEMFEAFWCAYPKRKGPPNKAGARKSFQARLREGVAPEKIIEAAKAYAIKRDWHNPRYPEPERLIPMAQTWLNQRRYEDYGEEVSKYSAEQIQAAMERYRQRRIKEGWL